MVYRVRIFLRRSDQTAGRYIGERFLHSVPQLHGRVAFQLDGGLQSGKVERIVPADWEPASEFIPTIHVLQGV